MNTCSPIPLAQRAVACLHDQGVQVPAMAKVDVYLDTEVHDEGVVVVINKRGDGYVASGVLASLPSSAEPWMVQHLVFNNEQAIVALFVGTQPLEDAISSSLLHNAAAKHNGAACQSTAEPSSQPNKRAKVATDSSDSKPFAAANLAGTCSAPGQVQSSLLDGATTSARRTHHKPAALVTENAAASDPPAKVQAATPSGDSLIAPGSATSTGQHARRDQLHASPSQQCTTSHISSHTSTVQHASSSNAAGDDAPRRASPAPGGLADVHMHSAPADSQQQQQQVPAGEARPGSSLAVTTTSLELSNDDASQGQQEEQEQQLKQEQEQEDEQMDEDEQEERKWQQEQHQQERGRGREARGEQSAPGQQPPSRAASPAMRISPVPQLHAALRGNIYMIGQATLACALPLSSTSFPLNCLADVYVDGLLVAEEHPVTITAQKHRESYRYAISGLTSIRQVVKPSSAVLASVSAGEGPGTLVLSLQHEQRRGGSRPPSGKKAGRVSTSSSSPTTGRAAAAAAAMDAAVDDISHGGMPGLLQLPHMMHMAQHQGPPAWPQHAMPGWLPGAGHMPGWPQHAGQLASWPQHPGYMPAWPQHAGQAAPGWPQLPSHAPFWPQLDRQAAGSKSSLQMLLDAAQIACQEDEDAAAAGAAGGAEGAVADEAADAGQAGGGGGVAAEDGEQMDAEARKEQLQAVPHARQDSTLGDDARLQPGGSMADEDEEQEDEEQDEEEEEEEEEEGAALARLLELAEAAALVTARSQIASRTWQQRRSQSGVDQVHAQLFRGKYTVGHSAITAALPFPGISFPHSCTAQVIVDGQMVAEEHAVTIHAHKNRESYRYAISGLSSAPEVVTPEPAVLVRICGGAVPGSLLMELRHVQGDSGAGAGRFGKR